MQPEPEFNELFEDYHVTLSVFSGPLDLLLTLIQRSELEIYDISIADIAEQYMSYVKKIQEVDLENASEFLILATKLLEIKSTLVLPRGDKQEDDDDPRLELIQKLLEYKKYRDIGITLNERMLEELNRYKRPDGLLDDVTKRHVSLEDIDVWDLYQAFTEITEQLTLEYDKIVYDDVPLETLMEKLRGIMDKNGGNNIDFVNCLGRVKEKITRVGLFLAVLEMMRLQEITASQDSKGRILLSFNEEN